MTRARIAMPVDNAAGRLGLLAEHGLSILVETGDARVLFDTGLRLPSPPTPPASTHASRRSAPWR